GLGALAHQDVPFEYLVEELNPRRSAARHPLFQVMLALQNTEQARFELPGLAVAVEPVGSGVSRVDLTLSLVEEPDGGMRGVAEFATDLFDRATVETFLGRWVRLLEQMTARPELPVGQADILTPDEHRELSRLDYVLDRNLRLVPRGVVGELYARGAEGDLVGTDPERWVPDPFGTPDARMYRTGDLARRRPDDGRLELVGPADPQAAALEIEAVLRTLPGVAETTVVVDVAAARSVAYVVPLVLNQFSVSRLHEDLKHRLPEHRLPAAIMSVPALPLTADGSLDRAALPDPDYAPQSMRTPRSPQEEILCGLFAEVLGVDRVGIDDGFFGLGGHSLLATRLVSRVRSVLGSELPLRAVFESPTVAGLAERLGSGGAVRPVLAAGVRPEPLPLSFAQRRLWFLHRLEGPSATYNMPLALRLSGAVDRDALAAALDDVVGRHESLRTVFAEVDGEACQRVLTGIRAPFEVREVDAGGLGDALAGAARYAFDLAAEVPIRSWLFSTGPSEHVLLVVLHHIAGDGWSMVPLARDLTEAYAARLEGEAPKWEPLPVQYADYALWQRDLLDKVRDAEISYWRDQLASLPEEVSLPADRARPAVASYAGETTSFVLGPDLHRALSEVA
ncbi:condensation domain-containing protein, partial [Kitasatospora putterlickiae]|uniref:condensation domain-containing protein n=1 Tax=Kitasatospora putterlickiae TaxID=221725 RepID=UPI0031D4A45D